MISISITKMKPILLLLIGLLNLITAFAQEPNKIALVVAISNYPASSGWAKLSSINDVKLIKDALQKQGFKEENIQVITDKQATYAGMKEAFDKYLIQRAHAGDIAFFHFSGHGQQIEDDNGDEADGLDESIVPYDAGKLYKPGADNHFRDDLLGEKLALLRKKLGEKGNVLITIDACHSGTMTRGVGIMRGTNEIYASPAFKSKQGLVTTLKDEAYNIINESKGLAPMACFFASSPDESNQEVVLPDTKIGVGSLSLAFSKSLANAQKNTTYRALFDNVKVEMSSLVSRQTPLAEGDLDNIIFGGKALGKPFYYTILKDTVAKTLTIPIGKIYGIFSNTTLKLYSPDTRDTAKAKPIARGIISEAGQYTSEIKLTSQIPDGLLKTAWVYLDAVNYGDLNVNVKLNISDPSSVAIIKIIFNDIKQATLVDTAAELFVESGMNGFSEDSIFLINAGEMVIWKEAKLLNSKGLSQGLSNAIGDYARSNYMRNLKLSNEDYNVTVEFVPLKCVKNCSTPLLAEYKDDKLLSRSDASGNIFFKNGDKFRFNITNHSNQKILYYTVLDIQPDNRVTVLIPGRKEIPADFKVLQGEKVELKKIFKISPPYGIDVLKVIASDVPLDLRSIFESRATLMNQRGSAPSPFEKLVAGTYKAEGNKTRGSDEEAIQPEAVNIVTFPYHIVK